MKILTSLLLIPALAFAQNQTPLFQLLPEAKTGIHFSNDIEDKKAHNILIYSNYYGGAGVGIGDFNKDGLPDIFFAGNLVADQLYLNKGNLVFEEISKQAGIQSKEGWSSGVLVGDVNNDGWQDVYVTRELYDEDPERRKNVLYINNGDLTFSEQAAQYGLDDSERTRHATFIDYNKDGWLDLFLLNQPPNPGNYSSYFGANLMTEEWAPRLYKNNGDGSFSDVSKSAGVLKPGYGNSVIAADLNKDGWQDLYVANDYDAPDFLYLNNGDGTFTNIINESMRHISYYSMGVDAADINNDGWLDLMTLDMVAEDNFRLKSNMGGMYPEVFWKIVNKGGHHQYMFNAFHLNNGDWSGKAGTFSDISQMAGVSNTDWSWANLIADFDNDGWKDIFVTNGLLRDIRNTDSSKDFPKYVRKVIDEFIKENPNAGDVDIFDILDLDKALALIPSVPLKNFAFKNKGGLTFDKVTDDWGFDQKTFSNGAAYADFDQDGDLDLIINNINERAFLYENTSNKLNRSWLKIQLVDSKSNQTLIGTKVKLFSEGQMQFQELASVRGMYSSSENKLLFGLDKAKECSLEIVFPNGALYKQNKIKPNQELIIDFSKIKTKANSTKGKEKQVFFTVDNLPGLQFQHKENAFDDYSRQVLLPHKMSQFGPALAVGDINGDGLDDLFAGGAKDQASAIYLQNGKGQFKVSRQSAFIVDIHCEDIDASFLDIDQDGDLDLYVVSGGNAFAPQNKAYQDRLYLNDGKGNFQNAKDLIPIFRESGSCVRPFDYDQDGDLDLFIGGRHNPWDYPAPTVSRLLRNDGGKFTDVTKTAAKDLIFIGLVTDASWSDFDEDGDSDLMIVGEWMPLTILENENGNFKKLEESKTSTAGTGWFYAIKAVDFDQDGDEDYFLGNLGLNYKYKASPEEPFEVHYADFDQSGDKDIVLSYYNFGEQYPLRGRSCSSEQVPILKEKFPTYNIFAESDLETVYGAGNLAQALHYSASNFASVYLENKGNGKFNVIPLPEEAQISSINDFLIEDFDEDGRLDVLLVGNLYTAEIETPRNDAGIGLLLKGDKTKRWRVIPASQSGISLPYDVKKIKALKSNNSDYYLFAVNDGALKILKRN